MPGCLEAVPDTIGVVKVHLVGCESARELRRLHPWRAGRFQFNLERAHLNAPDRRFRGANVQITKKHAGPMFRGFPNQIDLGTIIENCFGNDAGWRLRELSLRFLARVCATSHVSHRSTVTARVRWISFAFANGYSANLCLRCGFNDRGRSSSSWRQVRAASNHARRSNLPPSLPQASYPSQPTDASVFGCWPNCSRCLVRWVALCTLNKAQPRAPWRPRQAPENNPGSWVTRSRSSAWNRLAIRLGPSFRRCAEPDISTWEKPRLLQ